jgi:hypothetical protein
MSDLIEGYDKLFANHDVVSMQRDHWVKIRREIKRLSRLENLPTPAATVPEADREYPSRQRDPGSAE